MARRRMPARARSQRNGGTNRARGRNRVGAISRLDGNVVPRMSLGAVDGVEILAVGALRLTRDVALTTVSGVASIGAEAVSATMDGARGVVSAASRMVGQMAGAAQGTFQATLENARRSRRGLAASTSRRSAASMMESLASQTVAAPARTAARSRRRTRRLRLAHPSRPERSGLTMQA
jgi:type IV secretory pathway TrbL component